MRRGEGEEGCWDDEVTRWRAWRRSDSMMRAPGVEGWIVPVVLMVVVVEVEEEEEGVSRINLWTWARLMYADG